MKDISVSNIFGKAWEIFKENSSDLVVLTFVYIILSIILSTIDSYTEGPNSLILLIISIVCGIGQMILALGFYRILLNTVDSQKSNLSVLFDQRRPTLILHYIIGSIVSGVAIVIGFIFLIIPGIYLAIRFQFFTYCLLEQEEPECIKALNDSWRMTEGHVLDLFALCFLSICIVILGFIALILGLFVAIPVAGLMTAIAYRILSSKIKEELPLKL
jgi:uncharacterized membrane protein